MHWLIELDGNEIDKSIWKALAKAPFDPHVIAHNISGNAILGLRSDEVDTAQSPREAMDIAKIVSDRIHGAISLEHATEPLIPIRAYSIHPDGSLGTHILVEPAILKLRGGWIKIGVRDAQDNVTTPTSNPSNLQRWNASLSDSDLIRDLMMFVGRANNWFDIYKALEIAIDLFGNEKELETVLKNRGGPDLKKLKRTANHYRHATKHNSLPQTPPNLLQAREQLARIAVIVLADKVPQI